MTTILLFGATGWIGQKLEKIMSDRGFKVIRAQSRLDDYYSMTQELNKEDFDYCFLSAGITRDPKNPATNIDWCEDNVNKTININYFGCLYLLKLCKKLNKKVIYLGTGCIYEYNEEHPISSLESNWLGYTEEDKPNFDKSMYSYSKILFEDKAKNFDNILILRLRMPIDSFLSPRNIITKLLKYEKIINIPNSMSVLDDLLPLIPDMLHLNGIYNFTNPGVISHNQLLDKYIKYVDKDFKYKNFSLEEQSKVIKAPRSNTALNCNKLLNLFPDVLNIQDSVDEVMKRIKNN